MYIHIYVYLGLLSAFSIKLNNIKGVQINGKGIYNKVSRRHTIIKALAITMLTFLILVSIADATQDSDAWVNKGNALFDLYKFDEAIKAYDKAIEINPQNINALQNRKEVLPLSQVGQADKSL